MDRAALLLRLTEDVRALTRPMTLVTHRAVHEGGRWLDKIHRVDLPSLLDQLRAAEPMSGDRGVVRVPESRTTARLDAVDHLRRIQAGAACWVAYRLHMSLRNRTEDNLAACLGGHSQLDDDDLAELCRDVRNWCTLARVIAGVDSPPRQLSDARCPQCDTLGSIRVRMYPVRAAACAECRASWDHTTIGVLAEHIRGEGRADDTPHVDTSCT